MVAINQSNGKILWDHKFKHSAFGAVSVTNDVAFTTTFDGTLWALNTSNGKVLWSQAAVCLQQHSGDDQRQHGDHRLCLPAWQGADPPDSGVHAHSRRVAPDTD